MKLKPTLVLSVLFVLATISATKTVNRQESVLAAESYLSVISEEKWKETGSSKILAKNTKINQQSPSTISKDNSNSTIYSTKIAKANLFVLVILGIIAVAIFVPRKFEIEADEVGIKYKKFGRPLPANRLIALNGEMGYQIEILTPGRPFLSPWWMYRVDKEKAIEISQNEIGLVEAKDGASLPQGQMFGKVIEECDNFQDGRAFITAGGQRGQQLAILRNGVYRINPKIFEVQIRGITKISKDEIGLVEAKDGQPLSFGKTFGDAVECNNFQDAQAFIRNGGCRGKQLQILTAGKYAINLELFDIKIVQPIKIEANEVGLVEAIDGQPLPLGQNFGKVVECNNFQDGQAFISNGGQKGKQLAILPPGVYYINTELFKVNKQPIITIPEGEMGLIVANEGQCLTEGQMLGQTVDCNNFQDAEKFIINGGQKGKQRRVLRAGDYRINTNLFTVITSKNAEEYGMKPQDFKVYQVNSDQIGIVTTFDGKPLLNGKRAGMVIDGHNKFQDVEKFISAGGYRGLQEEILEEGIWSLNPWFVKVKQVPLTKIKAETVGVVISDIGQDMLESAEQITDNNNAGFNIVPRGYKGIEDTPLQAGTHLINTGVKSIIIVPAHEITLDWSNREKEATNYDSNLKTLELRSKDGFVFALEVTQVINIEPKDAPKMISRVGSTIANNSPEVENKEEMISQSSNNSNSDNNAIKHSSIKNLVTRVLEPMVGNYFRNSAQEYDALDFLNLRDEIQEGATQHIKNALNAYGVQAVGTYINEIELPEELAERIKAQKTAEVDKETFEKQQETERELQKLIKEQEITASQAELVKAERNREIAEQEAKSKERLAEANAKEQKLKDDLEVSKKRQTEEIDLQKQERLAQIEAEKQERLVQIEMKAFRDKIQSLSPQLYAKLESDKAWSEALSKFKYQAPEVYIGGGNGGNNSSGGGMEALQSGQFNLMFLEFIQDQLKERKSKRVETHDINPKTMLEPSNGINGNGNGLS